MNDFAKRAAARRSRITITKKRLGDPDGGDTVRGAEAVSLVHRVTLTAWALSGKPLPRLARRDLPYRFIPGRCT
jgi:hypothetical protein